MEAPPNSVHQLDGWSPQEARLLLLYGTLAADERAWIVAQWDHQHGLESWQERLRKKEERPQLMRRYKIYACVASLLALCAFGWHWNRYEHARSAQRTLEYIYGRAPEYPPLHAGLKWIDSELITIAEWERDNR